MSVRRTGWTDDLDVLDAIEKALTPEQFTALHRMVNQVADVEPNAWLAVPGLRQVFGVAAVLNVRESLIAEGLTELQQYAVLEARLGIPTETFRTWLRRWSRYGRGDGQNEP